MARATEQTQAPQPEAAPAAELPTESTDGRVLRRQGRETMGRLLDAGVAALAESGYHAARVDDVVRLADVSHGTFYLYFPNKEALFRSLAERCAEETAELAASLPEVPSGPEGIAVLDAWLADFLALYRRSGVVIRAWAEQQVEDRALARLGRRSFGRIAAVLQERLPDDLGDDSARALRATALLAMLERFAYVATSRELGIDDAEVVRRWATVVHRGFFAPAAGAQAA